MQIRFSCEDFVSSTEMDRLYSADVCCILNYICWSSSLDSNIRALKAHIIWNHANIYFRYQRIHNNVEQYKAEWITLVDSFGDMYWLRSFLFFSILAIHYSIFKPYDVVWWHLQFECLLHCAIPCGNLVPIMFTDTDADHRMEMISVTGIKREDSEWERNTIFCVIAKL